jgi:Kef-type K+ transport system membrane component KefB/nucleotide-binding universal stress UspA family protein
MRKSLPFLTMAFALAAAGPAWAAAEAPPPTPPAAEVIFFIEIVLLIAAGRIGGELMQRIGQPAVMGQILAGIVLGPTVFGTVLPDLQAAVFPPEATQHGMIDAVAQLGILMLLLLTGMETDLRLVRRVGLPALFVSVTGIAVPFVLGFAVGEVAPEWIIPDPGRRVVTALFLGTALSIASVKIVAMVVRDLGFLRRDIGQIILAAAVLDDTLGWIIIGVISGLAADSALKLSSVFLTLLGVAVFIVASLTLGRRAVSLIIRWSNDNLVSEMPVISVILVVTIVMALITQAIGVHTVLGAFVAGVIIGGSPILTKHIDEELRGLITALFTPVFFCLAGLSADLTVLANPTLFALTVGLILIASLGKFAGAFFGGWLGGLSLGERVALACGMNARGSTEVIVATIGLSIGALNRDLYTMIVTMAVVTTLAMPPMLHWALARLPLSDDEKQRLDREAFEEKGFVSNLERLLLTADASANGKLASRLAGLIAGQRGLPTTLLRWHKVGPDQAPPEDSEDETGGAAAVSAAAETGRITEMRAGEGPSKVDVTTRLADTVIEEAVAAEAKKGYDMLFVGVEGTGESDSPVAEDVARAAEAFEGPLALAHARGEGDVDGPLRILVPVTGTGVARRAAEIAFALARASGGRVTALYVSPSRRQGRAIADSLTGLLRGEEAILRDIAMLGEGSGAAVRTVVRAGVPPAQAILRLVRSGHHNLVVMGVNRRPGESLSFGPVADGVLAKSARPVLFVAS